LLDAWAGGRPFCGNIFTQISSKDWVLGVSEKVYRADGGSKSSFQKASGHVLTLERTPKHFGYN
jgi:hypothetical protein